MRKLDLTTSSLGPSRAAAPDDDDDDAISISMADRLSASSSIADATAIVTEGLSILLSRSMNIHLGDIDASRPANMYGVDSLVAVGMRNWIFRETGGVDASVFEILGDNTIEELARTIAEKCKFVVPLLKDDESRE